MLWAHESARPQVGLFGNESKLTVDQGQWLLTTHCHTLTAKQKTAGTTQAQLQDTSSAQPTHCMFMQIVTHVQHICCSFKVHDATLDSTLLSRGLTADLVVIGSAYYLKPSCLGNRETALLPRACRAMLGVGHFSRLPLRATFQNRPSHTMRV